MSRPRFEEVWWCKIGGDTGPLPPAADAPMRAAIGRAYRALTRDDPEFLFSGWGGELTESQRAVVEDREPSEEHYEEFSALRAERDEALAKLARVREWAENASSDVGRMGGERRVADELLAVLDSDPHQDREDTG